MEVKKIVKWYESQYVINGLRCAKSNINLLKPSGNFTYDQI
jgi:hypothetical protein